MMIASTTHRPPSKRRPPNVSGGGILPWCAGTGGVIALAGALVFGIGSNREAAELRARLDGERAVTAKLKTLLGERAAGTAASAADAPDAAELDALGAERDRLRDALQTLETQLDQARAERDALQQRLLAATARLAVADAAANGPAASSGQRSDAALAALRAELDAKDRELRRGQRRLTLLGQQRDKLSSGLNEVNKKLAALSSERDALREQLAAAAGGDGQQTLVALRQQLADASRRAEIATRVVQQLALKLGVGDVDPLRPATTRALDSKLDDVIVSAAPRPATLAATPQPRVFASAVTPDRYFDAVQPPADPLKTPPQAATGDGVKLEEIHFSTGNVDLSPGGRRKARQIAALYHDRGLDRLRVLGFTDTVGGAAHNRLIAARRAQSVVDLLVDAGVPRERIEMTAYGEDRLPEPTADGVSEPLNRCVGIFAVR